MINFKFFTGSVDEYRKVAVFCTSQEEYVNFYRRMITGRRDYSRLNNGTLFVTDRMVFYKVTTMNDTRGRNFTHYINWNVGVELVNSPTWVLIFQHLHECYNIQSY